MAQIGHHAWLNIKVVLVRVVQVPVFDELFKLLLLEEMVFHVRVSHSGVHIYQSVSQKHILPVDSLLLVIFAPKTPSVDHIPHHLLVFVPLRMVLIAPDGHSHQRSYDVLVLLKLVSALHQRTLVFGNRDWKFPEFFSDPASRLARCSDNLW